MALLQITISIETSLFLLSLFVLHSQGALRGCHVGISGDVVTAGAPEEDCVCGQDNRNNHDRVTGGQRVEENEYPWQVLVQTMFEFDPRPQTCGGTLLDSLTVLTAAHCFYNKTNSNKAFGWMVILGEHDKNNPTGKEVYDGADMTSVILHPDYSLSLGSNDIALLFLTTPVSWSEYPHIRPACLPSEEATQENYVDRSAMATGWGKREVDAREGVPVLREVPVQVISQQTCRNKYKDDHFYRKIIDTGLFCAGEPGRDTCKGDSGGPLVVRDSHGQYEVIGVTKGGKGCGQVGYPGLYSSTIHYRAWILQQRSAWVQPDYEYNEGLQGCSTPIVEAGLPMDSSCGLSKGCCKTLQVSGKHFGNGEYVLTGQVHNNRVVYRGGYIPNKNIRWCIFYRGHWKIEACDWIPKSVNSQGLGWSRVDAVCPADIGAQWSYYKWGVGGFSGLDGATAQLPVDPSISVNCKSGPEQLKAVSASMSSTYGGRFSAEKCIDGVEISSSSLCHTESEKAPWLALDFGAQVSVEKVVILNRDTECCWERLRNAEVRVADQLPASGQEMFSGGALLGTFTGPGEDGQVVTMTSSTDIGGRFVIVQLDHSPGTEVLNLNEVTVWGRKQGYTGKRRKKRSYHGNEATMFDHPWQAFIIATFPSSSSTQCGGSLINDRTVLTTASCLRRRTEWGNEEADMVEVRLGEHDVTAMSARHSELIYNLTGDRIDVHPDYNHETLENDIAKVYLSELVNFSSHPWIHPICLADPCRNYSGSLGTATGWGWVAWRKMAETLQQMELDVLSSYDCSQVQRASGPQMSREKMICATGKTGRMCYGDSGGPLSVLRAGSDPEQRELLGILSHGSNKKCSVQGVPDIFTDVTKYTAWINEHKGLSEEGSKAINGGYRACCMRCWWHPQKKRCVSFNMAKACPCQLGDN